MMKNKKGVSGIVITVSMILVAIVAVGVISSFIIPMIRGQLGKTSACLSLKSHFVVRSDLAATCYDSVVNNVAKLSIQRGSEKETAKGMQVSIFMESGEAESYAVYNDTEDYSPGKTGFPSKGGARTYSFPIGNGEKVAKIAIATILESDETCDAQEYGQIRPC